MTAGSWLAVRAARAVHAYRAELARLAPPATPARAEQGTVAAATQVNTGTPARGWRTGQTAPVTALDGIGFTAIRQDGP
jgi:hypothetical protein